MLTNSTLSKNKAIKGGAIFNAGVATVRDTTLSNNTASEQGGGIYNKASLTVRGTTLEYNHALQEGGGVYTFKNLSLAELANSTLSSNTSELGGGIFVGGGELTLVNTTISANKATLGGGVRATLGQLSVVNTLIGAQQLGDDCAIDNGAFLASGGHNAASDNSCAFTKAGDMNNIVPALLPLANTGGPTQTHLPDFGSVLVNAGDPAVCAIGPISGLDQRGKSRDPLCDIGAVERQGEE